MELHHIREFQDTLKRKLRLFSHSADVNKNEVKNSTAENAPGH